MQTPCSWGAPARCHTWVLRASIIELLSRNLYPMKCVAWGRYTQSRKEIRHRVACARARAHTHTQNPKSNKQKAPFGEEHVTAITLHPCCTHRKNALKHLPRRSGLQRGASEKALSCHMHLGNAAHSTAAGRSPCMVAKKRPREQMACSERKCLIGFSRVFCKLMSRLLFAHNKY